MLITPQGGWLASAKRLYMKSITINPLPFWNAQVRTDWFDDPGAIKDWDTTFSLIKKLGFVQVRYNIDLRSIFDNVAGAAMPFLLLESPDLWVRRIDPVLKYCAVYGMKLLLVIDDIDACVEEWGVDGVASLLQLVVNRVGGRAKYSFDEIDSASDWQEKLNIYSKLMSSVDFKGSEVQAPPILVMPFLPWQSALAQFVTSPLSSKFNVNSINVYVDRRYSPSYVAAYSTLLTQAKVILSSARKPYAIHETGLSPDYAQVDDISRGEMLLQLERTIYKSGGFQDYGIYGTHDAQETPSGEQFSILNPNVLLGYLKGSGYSPAIIIPSKKSS